MSDKHKEQQLKALLESWNEELPPSVAGRLRAARYDAMNTTRRPRRHWQVPVTVFASLACIALLVPRVMPPGDSVQQTPPPAINGLAKLSPADMNLLAAGEELDLLENVEFILWLSELDDAGLG